MDKRNTHERTNVRMEAVYLVGIIGKAKGWTLMENYMGCDRCFCQVNLRRLSSSQTREALLDHVQITDGVFLSPGNSVLFTPGIKTNSYKKLYNPRSFHSFVVSSMKTRPS